MARAGCRRVTNNIPLQVMSLGAIRNKRVKMKAESLKEESVAASREDRDRELDSRAGVLKFLIDASRVVKKFGGPERRCEAEAWRRNKFEARLQELERPAASPRTEVVL